MAHREPLYKLIRTKVDPCDLADFPFGADVPSKAVHHVPFGYSTTAKSRWTPPPVTSTPPRKHDEPRLLSKESYYYERTSAVPTTKPPKHRSSKPRQTSRQDSVPLPLYADTSGRHRFSRGKSNTPEPWSTHTGGRNPPTSSSFREDPGTTVPDLVVGGRHASEQAKRFERPVGPGSSIADADDRDHMPRRKSSSRRGQRQFRWF
jgi:hypothetical protein